MRAFLLDVNVLIALVWPAHEAHQKVQLWFHRNSKSGWATCAFTQAAMVRILSNPSFSRDAVSTAEAINSLSANLEHPAHEFWPIDSAFVTAIEPFRKRVVGHQQVTDAYLLGLVIKNKGILATLDTGIRSLAGDQYSKLIEVI